MPTNPKFILVMRHAEKPADPMDPNLSEQGFARARSLATYIPETRETLGSPDFIFAAAISKHSARPYETVEPLAKATGKPIDATFADQDYSALASTLLSTPPYADQQLVVCWHHGNIPSLMRMLGCKEGAYPNPWDHKVFNLILKVEFAHGTPSVSQIVEPF